MASKARRCCCCGKPLTDGQVFRRGLHPSCYNTANRAVEAGETTWEALETIGKAKPSGRKQPRSAMGKAIAALSQKQ